MANQLGIPVVYDFRSNDMIGRRTRRTTLPNLSCSTTKKNWSDFNTAILNLGGLGNLSCYSKEYGLIALDTGPANAPLNDWIKSFNIGQMDIRWRNSSKGKVNESKIIEILKDPYFEMSFPKSLDRFDFSYIIAKGMSLEDGAATLTALVGASVGKALDLLPSTPDAVDRFRRWTKKLTMMQEISFGLT